MFHVFVLQVAPFVYDRQDIDVVCFEFVNDPIRIHWNLTDTLIFKLGHHTTEPRQIFKQQRFSYQRVGNTLGVYGGVVRDVVVDVA